MLLFLLAAFVLVHIPKIQTSLIQMVTDKISSVVAGDVSIGSASIAFIDKIALEDIALIGPKADTVVCVNKMLIDFSPLSAISKNLKIRRINIDGGFFFLETRNKTNNLTKVFLNKHLADSLGNLDSIPKVKRPVKDSTKSKLDFGIDINLKRLKISNFSFFMKNHDNKKPPKVGPRNILFNDMALYDIFIDMTDVKLSGGELKTNLKRLSAKERRGLNMSQLSGRVTFNDTLARLDDMVYRDGKTELNCEYYMMEYQSLAAFKDYVHKVKMGLKFKDTYLDFTSIGYFAALNDNLQLKLHLNGEISGTVTDIDAKKLKVQAGSGLTNFVVNAKLRGLPDFYNTATTINIEKLHTTAEDADWIIREITQPPYKAAVVSKFASGQDIDFSAEMKGTFGDFDITGLLATGVGDIDINAHCRAGKGSGFVFDGDVAASGVALGTILKNKKLSELSCNVSARAALSRKNMEVDLRQLHVSSLGFNGYDYSDIYASGNLNSSEFNGTVYSEDPNLTFLFNGLVTFNGQDDSRYRFNLDMQNADLAALNLHKRERSQVSFLSKADFIYRNNRILGNIVLDSLKAVNEVDGYNVGSVIFRHAAADSHYVMKLTSSFLEAKYEGDSPISQMLSDLKGQTTTASYHVDINTLDLRPICSFLVPDLFVNPGTSIKLDSVRDSVMTAKVESNLIAFKNKYIRDIEIGLKNKDSVIYATVDNKFLQLGNTKLLSNKIDATLKADSVSVRVALNEEDSLMTATLNADVGFPEGVLNPKHLSVMLYDSQIVLGKDIWRFYPSNIDYCDSLIHIDQFGLYAGNQSVLLLGDVGRRTSDSLFVGIDNFDLSFVNMLTKDKLKFGGLANGRATLSSLLSDVTMVANIKADSLSVSDTPIGNLSVVSNWVTGGKMEFAVDNVLNGKETLKASGEYDANRKEIDGKVKFDGFQMAFANPFLKGIMSDVSGEISGDISARGPFKSLKLECGNGRISDFYGVLDYTRVPYKLDAGFVIDDKGLNFKDTQLFDLEGHKADVTGGLQFKDGFKNLQLDTKILADNLLGINTTISDNQTFYGRGYATGDIRLHGPMNQLNLDINITTGDNTSFHIPLGSSGKEQVSLLRFINPAGRTVSAYDSLVRRNTQRVVKGKSSMGVNINVDATPEAEILLEINKDLGDVLRARGSGLVGITSKNGNFGIKGDYTIDAGSYKFVLMGLVSRDFELQRGGTIKFNGDIKDSDLDLKAIYKTKASLAPIVADSTISSRRLVNCGIDITGKLSDLKLGFNVEVPDLDPAIRGQVETALNTDDKVLKQFVTLLISGSFMPEGQSGVENNVSMSLFNATEILSNQINSVFRQLDIPLDLGFNYKPDQNGRSIFDVAISTQLFNNRVTINGNIGNRQYVTTNNQEVVGDVDVEIKVDKKGKVSVTLFSHSADKYSSYLDQTQRNGVGVTYREEFDTFKELIDRIFRRKKKEEAK